MTDFQQMISDIPGTLFGIITSVVGVINGILGKTFGDKLTIFVVIILSFVGGYFLREAIVKSGRNNYFWFAILSLLIFCSLRYIGLGG